MRMRSWIVGVGLLAAAGAAEALPAVQIGANYTSATLATSQGFIPPDSQGAVGPDHVAVFTNGAYRVYDKGSGQLLAGVSLDAFWNDAGVVPIDGSFDPRVLYDAASQRWFALAADGAPQP